MPCDHSTCGWAPRYDAEGCPLEPEPPMTSEEEEEAPGDCTCGNAGDALVPAGHYKDCPQWSEDEALAQFEKDVLEGKAGGPLPPQPVRRPPYAVAYSVQGHLYEVALPGDATVRAIDGALVIQHHLGPVAGIVQVLPVLSEGGAHDAEADH